MSITKSQNARVMSEEAIQYLCKCINLVNSLPTSVIDNLHLADNLTFSSTKIDTLLTTLKEDCNKYTDSIVANLSRLELKVVTDEADMIEHNKLYLLKKNGETSYSQYVIVTNDRGVNEKILLGTCDISMTDYLKIADADLTYCKKTDFNLLNTEVTKVKATLGNEDLNTTKQTLTGGVNELKSDVTTHVSNTDIHVTKTKTDLWDKVTDKVDKTDITTTIDSTSTDTQVPSAKDVYVKAIKDKNLKTYTSLSQLGLTEGSETLSDIATNMSNNSMAILNVQSSCNVSEYPVGYGVLTVNKLNINRVSFIFTETGGASTLRQWFASYNAGKLNGWKRVCTTSVADTSLKTLTNSSDINSDTVITYMVKNGRCSISVNTVSSTKMSTGNITLTTGLPIPVNPSCWYSLCTNSNATNAPQQNLLLRIDSSGNLIAYKGTDNINYFGSFTYLVAES